MLRLTLLLVFVTILGNIVSADDTDIDTKDAVKYLERGHKMILECHHKENKHSPVIWSKGGSDLSNDSVITISQDTNTLIISRPEPHHAGNYTCKLGDQAATIQVFMNVSVINHETSKNQVEGDPLQITCDAIGYPAPEVSWYKDSELLQADDRISFEDNNNVVRGKLIIKDLNFNDKGMYKCVATNAHSKGQMEITVRVKDKYAALWPFLGICAEVAILCTIICIYEKRRSKPEFEDESDDKADRKEGHDVRQRK